MRILLGTTNPSKVKRFSDLLKGYDVEFVTLKDLAITDEPEENGTTPEENAIAKAKFYGQYFEVVICNDSGLYFEELALDDVRQPLAVFCVTYGCYRTAVNDCYVCPVPVIREKKSVLQHVFTHCL